MTTELDRFKTILATIALREPELSLGDALLVAHGVESEIKELPLNKLAPWDPDWDDPEEVASWVREQPKVVAYAKAGKKIDGIKEIRGLTGLGLKEAKEAFEAAFPPHPHGMPF